MEHLSLINHGYWRQLEKSTPSSWRWRQEDCEFEAYLAGLQEAQSPETINAVLSMIHLSMFVCKTDSSLSEPRCLALLNAEALCGFEEGSHCSGALSVQ